MGRGAWGPRARRLKRLGERDLDLRPDADATAPGQPAYDPPLERWTRELLTTGSGPALYGDEGAYDRWVRTRGRYLRFQIGRKLVEARGERVPLGWVLGRPPALPERYAERVAAAAEPILEHWRERFEEARDQREAKQMMGLGGRF